LTLGIVLIITALPVAAIDAFLVPFVLVCSIAFMVLSRKFESDLLAILYPLGLSFVLIGLFEICRLFFAIEETFFWQSALRVIFSAALIFTTSRAVLVHYIFNVLMRKRFRRQVILVGANERAKEFAGHIRDLNAPFWVAGTIDSSLDQTCQSNQVPNKACLGNFHDLPEIAAKHNISEIVITSERITKQNLVSILDFCTSTGINAWFSASLLPIIDVKLYIDKFCGITMIRLCSQKRSWLFYKLKHISDALITLPAFILQLPLFLLIMALIKMESKGPVFYKARAIGKGGRVFDMYKFRSMYVDSDKSIHQEYVTKLIKGEIAEEEREKGPIKIVDDPRITRVGKVLRKLSLDELPQLINVLKGQMSLVGPRPCLPYEYNIYQDWHKKRTAVRPGITGLWQVTGRSEVLFEDMILLDLYYIYNSSIMLDLQILFETVFVVLNKKGAF
jgi:undecaprenyl-phosphate galactose phosphotransferase